MNDELLMKILLVYLPARMILKESGGWNRVLPNSEFNYPTP